MPFVTAEQLTNAVNALAKLKTMPSHEFYRGTSDHLPHSQVITFKGTSFTLITFNVLLPRCIPYINGIPLPGGKLPGWYKGVESQMGLESSPFASPYDQEHREQTIIRNVLTTLKHSHRTVFCLQECGIKLRNALFKHAAIADTNDTVSGFRMHPQDSTNDCITLWTCDLNGTIEAGSSTLSLYDNQIQIHNVHLPFATVQAKEKIRECCIQSSNSLSRGGEKPICIIAGDFNVPATAQSAFVFEENVGTADIVEIAEWVADCSKAKVSFALHPRHFTNWAPKINCAQPEHNWDHMDNIMVVDLPGTQALDCFDAFWSCEYY